MLYHCSIKPRNICYINVTHCHTMSHYFGDCEVFMDNNAFGKLVRSYRKERGWKQEELADRWGFTREYVSQVERGKRKLDKPEQVTRLAEILGISEEQLTY